MIVELVTPSELDVESVTSEAGKIKVVPAFFGTGRGLATCLMIKVATDAGEELSRCFVKVNAATGKCVLVDRTKKAKPVIERLTEKKA